MSNNNKTEIIYGIESIMEKINAFIQNSKGELDVIFDFHAPSILIKTPIYYDGFKDLLKRGCRIRVRSRSSGGRIRRFWKTRGLRSETGIS